MNCRTALAFATLTLIAGVNLVAIKFSNATLSPLWGAGLRFTGAGILLAWFVVVTRRPLPSGMALGGAMTYGVLGFGAFFGLMYFGLTELDPGLTSVLLALVPLSTLLVAILHGTEGFRWQRLAGALIAVIGIYVLMDPRASGDIPWGAMLAVLLASFAHAEASVTLKRLPRGDPYATNAVAMLTGGAFLFGASVTFDEARAIPASLEAWAVYLYLTLVGTILLFGIFLYVLGNWRASSTSHLFLLTPIVTMPISVVLTGESFGWRFALGAAIVFFGIHTGLLRSAAPGSAIAS